MWLRGIYQPSSPISLSPPVISLLVNLSQPFLHPLADVVYDVADFPDKNKDTLNQDVVAVLVTSGTFRALNIHDWFYYIFQKEKKTKFSTKKSE